MRSLRAAAVPLACDGRNEQRMNTCFPKWQRAEGARKSLSNHADLPPVPAEGQSVMAAIKRRLRHIVPLPPQVAFAAI